MITGIRASITLVLSMGTFLCGFAAGVRAEEPRLVWQIQRIAMPERAAHIVPGGTLTTLPDIIIEAESGAWYRLADCAEGLCAELFTGAHTERHLPPGALPGSEVAEGANRIARAWLADPAQRFQASAVGANIAGTLIVEDRIGRNFRLETALDEGFEDRRVHIEDIDGNGIDTLFAVKSSQDQGAALVAVRLEAEGLLRIAASTAPVGHPNGWLNVIGAADFTGAGHKAVALVRTPGPDGQLQILDCPGDQFALLFAVPGVNNFSPATTALDMAVIADFDGDGLADIAVPDATRQAIRILSFRGGQVAEPSVIALPAPVATEIAAIAAAPGKRPLLLMGLENGELVLLH